MTEIRIIESISYPSTQFLERGADQGSHVRIAYPNDRDSQHLPEYIANRPLFLGRANRFLGDNWSLAEMPPPDNESSMAFIVSPDEIPDQHFRAAASNVYDILRDWRIERVERNHVRTIDDVRGMLLFGGKVSLAERVAYFASDDDLTDGDIPLIDASARGFLSFFDRVESEGKVSLTCSPQGWLCAGWRFSDKRRASLWFIDDTQVMFAATDAAGDFIEIDGGREVGSSLEVLGKLVDAGLLTWSSDSKSFHITTMLRDTVVSETSPKMEYPWKAHFYFGMMSPFFQLTGANTSTLQNAEPKSTALLSH